MQKSYHIFGGVSGRRDAVNGVRSAAAARPLKQALELQKQSDPLSSTPLAPAEGQGAADMANATAADPQKQAFLCTKFFPPEICKFQHRIPEPSCPETLVFEGRRQWR